MVWGVIMVGLLGDTCWSNFCTGNCVAICTGSGNNFQKCGLGWIGVCCCFCEFHSIPMVLHGPLSGCMVGWIGMLPSKARPTMVNGKYGICLRRFV